MVTMGGDLQPGCLTVRQQSMKHITIIYLLSIQRLRTRILRGISRSNKFTLHGILLGSFCGLAVAEMGGHPCRPLA